VAGAREAEAVEDGSDGVGGMDGGEDAHGFRSEQLRREIAAYARQPFAADELDVGDLPVELDLDDDDVDCEAIYDEENGFTKLTFVFDPTNERAGWRRLTDCPAREAAVSGAPYWRVHLT
jgi:hypothetical protein